MRPAAADVSETEHFLKPVVASLPKMRASDPRGYPTRKHQPDWLSFAACSWTVYGRAFARTGNGMDQRNSGSRRSISGRHMHACRTSSSM